VVALARDKRFRESESYYRAAIAAEPSNDFAHHSFGVLRPTSGGIGCNPLADPLWADEHFRASMQSLGLQMCPQARAWPIASPR
jgi:hypothetical protein